MSLINRMLQDLDRRNAIAGKDGKLPPQQVRPVPPERAPQTALWRVVAGLVIAALGVGAWMTYEAKRPRKIPTERAFMADERPAPARPAPPAAQPPAPKEEAPSAQKQEPAPGAREQAKPAEMESFKLALSIDTPITKRPERTAAPAERERPKNPPPVAALAEPAPPQVQKRDHAYTPTERAESAFARGVARLNQGRVAEAENELMSALSSDPRHEPARQALIALLLEQRRIDEATALLREGLQLDPQQPQFAMVLARIQMERRDYAGAVETLSRAKAAAATDAEYAYLTATALQRLARHREAAEYYEASLALSPQSSVSWLGLGISLEALQRRQEAAEAYRHALAGETLSSDLRAYAEQRAKQLR